MEEGVCSPLVQSLIDAVNDIASTGEYRKIHKRECTNLARRVKLLAPLFEEVKECKEPLPDDAIDCFKSLAKALESARKILQQCHNGSKLFLVEKMADVACAFEETAAALGKALDGLPYDLLDVSDEVREQVELVHAQLKRNKGRIDVQDMQLSEDIQSLRLSNGREKPDRAVLERLAQRLDLKTEAAMGQESKALESMKRDADAASLETLEEMNRCLQLLADAGGIELPPSSSGVEPTVPPGSSGVEPTGPTDSVASCPTLEKTRSEHFPPDFRCPISLGLMRDPVILASGQTYERSCIQKWLDDGNDNCPVTRMKLLHQCLTPNYVLRSLIAQWCETHGMEVPRRPSSSRKHNSLGSEVGSKDAAEVASILKKLRSQSEEEQRAAAGELRYLAKRSVENRICIADAGAIPLLVNLLRSGDLRTQEHAVTALLNLSIFDDNKGLIVSAGAIDPIVGVLKSGSMEARENAAATLFSLSVLDENKVTIGSSGAIPALVDLLRDGTQRGKKDAATALFNLSIYQGNKARAVGAGVVPPLMQLLVDQTAGMLDEALAILAILATHQEGRVAIGQASAIPTLVDLIRSGSPRNKENAAAVLLALSISDAANAALVRELGALQPLKELSETGTTRAKRKSSQLLEHLKRSSLRAMASVNSSL